jgi:hypothetical protein
MSLDIAAEVAEWLEQDIPGQFEQLERAAALVERRRDQSPNAILIRVASCDWPVGRKLFDIEPRQLRAIAQEHEHAAEQLQIDAADLRNYADEMERPTTPLAVAMREHLGVMRAEHEHDEAKRAEEREIAYGEGGVYRLIVNPGLRDMLYRAGYLRIEDVHRAVVDGTLAHVEGIGHTRLQQITRALGEGR